MCVNIAASTVCGKANLVESYELLVMSNLRRGKKIILKNYIDKEIKMVIEEKMQEAINKQINREFYSAYLYLSMSAYFESTNLKGFSHWMRAQAKEEVGHAMKLYDYLNERGGRVILSEIESPQSEWESPLAAFGHTYEHEKKVTEMINNLVNLAKSENDHAAETSLQWFVNEQIEEESSSNEILQKLKLIKDSPSELYMLDRKLAER